MPYDRHGNWQDTDNETVGPDCVGGGYAWKAEKHGKIRYDDQYGHVCTCTEKVVRDQDGNPDHPTYKPTVKADRNIEPTDSGSYWYFCTRCGAGAWSGA
jgi:hypothetical protein